MNIIEAQAHAKGYSDGYKAAERNLHREIAGLRKELERLERERDEAGYMRGKSK